MYRHLRKAAIEELNRCVKIFLILCTVGELGIWKKKKACYPTIRIPKIVLWSVSSSISCLESLFLPLTVLHLTRTERKCILISWEADNEFHNFWELIIRQIKTHSIIRPNSLDHRTKLTWSSNKTHLTIKQYLIIHGHQNSLDDQTNSTWSSDKTHSIIRQNLLDHQTKLTRSSDKTHSIIWQNSLDYQTKLTWSSEETQLIIRQNSLDHQTNSLDHQTKLSFLFFFFF